MKKIIFCAYFYTLSSALLGQDFCFNEYWRRADALFVEGKRTCNKPKMRNALNLLENPGTCPVSDNNRKKREDRITEIKIALASCKSTPASNRVDAVKVQEDRNQIESARNAPNSSEKERLYKEYEIKCYYCKDSIEVRIQLQNYAEERQHDKFKFNVAQSSQSLDDFEAYISTCFFCDDSTTVNKWIDIYKIREKRKDEAHWREACEEDTYDSYQRYASGPLPCAYKRNALDKMALIREVEKWSPNMLPVKGGKFTMGFEIIELDGDRTIEIQADNEKAHRVDLDAFEMSACEVSFFIFDLFCEDTGRDKPYDNQWGRKEQPVINVNWYEAIEFCNWLSRRHGKKPYYTIEKVPNESGPKIQILDPFANGYRLPTEAEWEYAAKGPAKPTLFGNGQNIASSAEMAFYCKKIGSNTDIVAADHCSPAMQPAVVKYFKPNGFGFYHLAGNVGEWCWDGYHKSYNGSGKAKNPMGDDANRIKVTKGGGWSRPATECRASARFSLSATSRTDFIGFRIAKNAGP